VLVEEVRHKERHAASSSSRGISYYRTCSKLEYNRRTYRKDVAALED
jgi:hypothetical protein